MDAGSNKKEDDNVSKDAKIHGGEICFCFRLSASLTIECNENENILNGDCLELGCSKFYGALGASVPLLLAACCFTSETLKITDSLSKMLQPVGCVRFFPNCETFRFQ